MELNIACVGAGVIGSSWAIAFARAGAQVTLFDPAPAALEAAQLDIDRALANLTAAGASLDPLALSARIVFTGDLEEALAAVDYVQESAPERVDVKRELFERMDSLAPANAVLASSTSEIPSSRFVEDLTGRQRCLVAHPFNPPHLVPVVELCPNPWTSAETMKRAAEIQRAIGQVPIELRREVPGFILNRLQIAVNMEALHLVGEDVCSASDLDLAMRLGLGFRWATIGPFATSHLSTTGGYRRFIEKYGSTMRSIAEDLVIPYDIPADLPERIHQDIESVTGEVRDTESVQRERDARLFRLGEVLRADG